MRFLDLAVAVVIGTSSLVSLLTFSPAASDSSASVSVSDEALRTQMLKELESWGLVWAQNAQAGLLCASLASASNSSLTLSAVVDGQSCPPSPPGTAVTLAMQLGSRELVLEAWRNARV